VRDLSGASLPYSEAKGAELVGEVPAAVVQAGGRADVLPSRLPQHLSTRSSAEREGAIRPCAVAVPAVPDVAGAAWRGGANGWLAARVASRDLKRGAPPQNPKTEHVEEALSACPLPRELLGVGGGSVLPIGTLLITRHSGC